MHPRIKNLFYIPSWSLFVLLIVSVAALLLDVILLTRLADLQAITIDGIEYAKGTDEYLIGIARIKKSIWFSGVVASLVSFVILRILAQRKKVA